ncbi:unnamed protein product [Ophioblennius macclurei]
MKKRSRRQKKAKQALGGHGTMETQSKRKTPPRLSKLQCEKSQLVLEAVVTTQHCDVAEVPDKREKMDTGVLDRPLVISAELKPFPLIPRWKDSDQVRLQMFGHDSNYMHSANFLKKHPEVEPLMRSILLSWLIEVCEAYTLHRQTFYLAQDYFDRFMMTQSNVQKDILQLIGITCLFIAAKMEEAHPPKLRQMVYVTADTYNEQHIIQMELIILKHLRWQLTPETPLSWMNLFYQFSTSDSSTDLLERQFPLDPYLQMTRLLDLCMLSINALDFRKEVLAASVLCYFIPQERVETVTDLPKHVIQPCFTWMAPFAQSASRLGKETLKDFAGKKIEDRHTIQTHADYLSLLDEASQRPQKTPGGSDLNTVNERQGFSWSTGDF